MTGTTISGTHLSSITLSNPALQNPAIVEAGATVMAAGVIGGYAAIYGAAGTAWTIVNDGLIAAPAGPGTGIRLGSSGTIVNDSIGTATGSAHGVDLEAGGTVFNQGTISAGTSGINPGAIYMVNGGYVTNQSGGLISAAGSGILGLGADAVTVANQGEVTAASNGIYIDTGGSVTNQSGGVIQAGGNGIELLVAPTYGGSVTNQSGGLIQAGNYGIYVSGGSAVNQGYISAGSRGLLLTSSSIGINETGGTITATGDGVVLYGGSFTNQSGAILSGGNGILVNQGAGTVVNAGTVTGASAGMFLAGAGTVTNQAGGTISGYHAIYGGIDATAVTVVNAGSLAGGAMGSHAAGVYLLGGGYVINQAGGTISGYYAIYGGIDATAVTVVNAGSLAGSTAYNFASGVALLAGGSVTNQSGGAITGYQGVYGGYSGSLTVINAGSIAAAYGDGVIMLSGGSVTNQSGGSITGADGIVGGTLAALVVVNAGGIEASGVAGVFLAGGGSVTNQSGGTISGYGGVFASYDAVSVVNAGSIMGSLFAGIDLFAGGSVTNQSGGTISGYGGISGGLAQVTVVNAGMIAAGAGYGIDFVGGGSVTNQSGGTIVGYDGIYGGVGGALTVVNAGTIAGTYGGIGLFAGGAVTNQSGGTIRGFVAVYANVAAATVVNYGSVLGGTAGRTMAGVVLLEGGSISNQSGGTIVGFDGIYGGGGGALTVVNAGSITSPDGDGIVLYGVGNITNQAGGSITGYQGIVGENAAVTVVNYGSVAATGTSGVAVDLFVGGSVTNAVGGSISGFDGVGGGNDAALTVVNAGQITGTVAAVQFVAGYADRLVVDSTAVFEGLVDGGNLLGGTAASTLELAAGSSAGTLSGIGTQFVDFAQITIDGGASWIFTGANYFATGTTLTNAGTLTVLDTTLSDGGLVVNDGTILVDPSSVTLASLTGSGGVTIGNGSTLDVLGSVTVGETIAFNGGGLLGVGPTTFAGQIDGFTVGDTIELIGVTDGFSPAIVNGNTLEIQRTGNPAVALTLDPGVDYTGDTFVVSDNGAVTEVAPCFLRGTLIRTGRGEVPVELLAVGDCVVTLAGSLRPIRWIGHRSLDLVRHPTPHRAQPICVRADAFGEGRPNRDLLLSPDHAVLWDGALVPVRLLVNGASIRRDGRHRRITYYHVELETHDILLAENLAVESYLETGNRGMFENTGEPLLLHPDLTNDQARRVASSCAPFVDDPTQVQPIWQVLAVRAQQRGLALPLVPATTDDPGLCVIVDGHRLASIGVTHGPHTTRPHMGGQHMVDHHGVGKHTFVLPAGATEVRLRSRSAVPSDMAPWVSDDRRLGVLLRGLTVRSGADAVPIPLDHPSLRAGWWRAEWHGPATLRRWTGGDAVVSLREPAPDRCLLDVEVAATMAYPLPNAASRLGSIRRSA